MITINLISGPRNISTALMYSFAQRSDTEVMDEPYYAVYLRKTGLPHPGREEVLRSLPATESEVNSRMRTVTKPVLFIKNMAHHLEVLDSPLIEGAVNVFLIRNPLHIITSYSKVIETPTMRDIGLRYQYSLFSQMVSAGKQPVVVDSGLLLEHAAAVLRKLCVTCGLPFQESMLKWAPGPKSYDGVWAAHWYGNVHRSTGFEPPRTSQDTLAEGLQPLYNEAKMLYEKLLPFSLKA